MTIDRLLKELQVAHTGAAVLRGLASIPPLSEADAAVFLKVIAENREAEA